MSVVFLVNLSLLSEVQAADLNKLEDVLEIFSDSRLTRDLKESNNQADKKAFMDTLEREVYKPVDQKIIEEVSKLPEYEGKRIITHDFRTPGEDGVNVNTDRDVRVLVEVELDRWVEVPVSKWENTYYKEFARRTNYKAGKLDNVGTAEMKKHAGRYRQLPTDKFHMEASRDFSDLGSIKVYGSVENYKLVSTPNIVRAKKGLNTLKDPEGLAYMYREKADEQYREARDIEAEMEQRVKDGIPLSTPERIYYEDIKAMHEVEGTVQLKKGVETLEKLRESYQKMGYDTGQLSAEMMEAVDIIKEVDGTSRTDIKSVKSRLDKLGFNGLDDLNQKVISQMDSLKLAKKYQKPRFRPDLSLETAGKWAGIAGDLMAIKDSLDKVKQGNHLLFNFEKDDSRTEKTAKALAAAALELAPVPVIDAVERGWQVDKEEKEYLKIMNTNGRAGGWETHPLTSIARVSTKITYRTAKSLTIDTLVAGKTAVTEGYQALGDISKNFLADFERSESERLQAEKMEEYKKRSEEFGLGLLLGETENGRSLDSAIKPGEVLKFSTTRNENWTDKYRVKWELEIEPGHTVDIKETIANSPDAEQLVFKTPILKPGEHTVWLRVFDRQTNLQLDFRKVNVTISDEIDLGEIRAVSGYQEVNQETKQGVNQEIKQNKNKEIKPGVKQAANQGGKSVTEQNDHSKVNQPEIGDILSFVVNRIGDWNDEYRVEWLLNGERYKYGKASDSEIHLLRFATDELTAGNYKLAVRILDSAKKIRAHQVYNFKLIDTGKIRLNKFTIRGSHNTYDGPVINRPIENGEVLAFEAKIKHPVFREEITPLTRLIWQVYDGRGKPLSGLSKVLDIVENGISKNYQFRILAENMPNGNYYVSLTQLLPAQGLSNEERFDFKVNQPVRISRVLVTDDRDKQEDRTYLYLDQRPLFYVYYDLAEGQKVNIRLTASKNGSVLEDISVERPREGETAPYRIGMALKKNIFKDGDIVDFAVEIRNKNGYSKSSHKKIQFVSYKLMLIVPDTVRTGEENRFEIRVPANFKEPYNVDINVGKGLGVGYQPGQLKGTLTGIVTGSAKKVLLRAEVTDASGNTAEASREILVEPLKASAGTPALNQQLVEAVDDGDVTRVKELLEMGANPNSEYKDNYSLLHYDKYDLCYIAEYLRVARLLLDYGGDINRLAKYGTPLYYISDYTYSTSGLDSAKIEEMQEIITDIIKLYIEYGADVNLQKQGRHSPLWMAASNYNLSAVKVLLNNGALYENGLLEWIRENSLDRAKTAAGKMVAGAYNYQTEDYVVEQFNEIELLLRQHYGK